MDLPASQVHTEIISQQLLVLQRILCTHGHNGAEGTHCTKPFWTALLATPLNFTLEDVEHGDHISKTARRRELDIGVLGRDWVNLLLDLNVAKGQRDKQHLDLVWLGGQRQQQGEDVINALGMSISGENLYVQEGT